MTRTAIRTWLALLGCTGLCLGFVAGCGGTEPNKDIPDLLAFLQKPRSPVAGVPYVCLPPDIITISSQHVPEIDKQTQQISPDGKINLPLIGQVFVAGKTTREIEELLKKEARKYYRDEDETGAGKLDVTVLVTGYNSQKIYVWGDYGAVGAPGPQPYTGNDTVMDVLARTQPTYLSWPEHVKIIRAKLNRGGYRPYNKKFANLVITSQPDSTQPADDSENVEEVMAKDMEIDLMAMIKTGDMSRNVLLYPNDIVFVPDNPFGNIGMALTTILFPVTPVLTAVQVPASINSSVVNVQNAGHVTGNK